LLFLEEADDRVRARGVDLRRGRARKPEDVPGELDGGHLEAVADAQVRDLSGARELDRANLAFHPPRTEPARNEDRVRGRETGEERRVLRDILGVVPLEADLYPEVSLAVVERLPVRQVGVAQLRVLSDDRDLDRSPGSPVGGEELLPRGVVGRTVREMEHAGEERADALSLEDERHLVDERLVGDRD